ncbi:hypothetical protein GQ54DRAFT_267541 [Martensiomyces pterosporus]|nr:hypothetical protein GQ54DRAFT_267541 [Martensiomyces pterosporus]
MLDQVNDVRAKAGKSAVQLMDKLNGMAQEQSDYQKSINQMTHSSNRGSLGDRLRAMELNWRAAAENVAYFYPDVDSVMQAWIKSPGHYANLIGDYNFCGFGENSLYWTQEFARIVQ